jgi:SecY interacting protein Syd
MSDTQQALDQLINQWVTHYEGLDEGFPMVEKDPEWPSACEIDGSEADGQVQWKPVKRDPAGEFSNVEHALDIALHEDIKTYYSLYWSEAMNLEHEKGPLSLLQIYNDEDFSNLQENIIGHIIMKRRLKQKVTIFFGLTDQDDQMISLVNDTGEIWLESVGLEPHLKLADSMTEFLGLLKIPG